MSDKSAIEWTDATWNPVHGCSKVSPGCDHCYAEALSLRYGFTKRPWTPENATDNVMLKPHKLPDPLKWREPRMVFVNSMSDLFHPRVPADYIRCVFDVMAQAEQHTFQVLTKRPKRMRSWCKWFQPVPLENVWLGTSIESHEYNFRADVLREIPAAVRFISAEPLLGPLLPKVQGDEDEPVAWWPHTGAPCVPYDGIDLTDIDWLIVGGESGPEHRPIDPEWVRDLRDACEHFDVAFFFKQWGGRTSKSGGRLLDGRTWDEMPRRTREAA